MKFVSSAADSDFTGPELDPYELRRFPVEVPDFKPILLDIARAFIDWEPIGYDTPSPSFPAGLPRVSSQDKQAIIDQINLEKAQRAYTSWLIMRGAGG